MTSERQEFLWDIFVTAVEGGINYWARIGRYRPGEDLEPNDDFYAEIVDPISVDENGSGVNYIINQQVIIRGLDLICTNKVQLNSTITKDILYANMKNDGGEIDAERADCIVQAGLFGKVIYG